MGFRPFFAYFCTLIFLSIMDLSIAADIISLAHSIRDGEKLVSASQRFELGFFSPGNSNNRYLGIWYKFSPITVVWVANRRTPITDKQAVLVLNDDGNLALLNKDKSIIWFTNSSNVPENPVAQLQDSGNLVLRDKSSDSYVWQSFDYPSDTLLAGMKLGWNLRTGFERYLTTWKSNDDPSPGGFSLRLEINGPQLLIAAGSNKKHRSGPWSGKFFDGIPMLNGLVFKPMLVQKQDELYYMYEPADNAVITRLLLDQSGTMKRFVWKTNEWTSVYNWPVDACDTYKQCGPNGICRISKTPICECLKGFIPEEDDVWNTQGLSGSKKCIEKLPAECHSGEGFLKLPATKLPDFFWSNNSMNLKECGAECYKNCSCKAYAPKSDVRGGGSGCLMWFGELIDISECPAGFTWGQDMFLRVPASELESVNYLNKKRIMIIVAVATLAGMSILGFVLCKVRKRTKNRGLENREEEAEVPIIDFGTIVAATNNFSEANMIGEGGFGPVYKGTLPTGQEFAVKRLSKNSQQGVEEFKNEVVLIGKLQHRNLVGLIGCCIHGDERMLLYEYMPNKSLDYFIFDHERSKLLSWRKRLDIIIGIARGLLYLHQDSKLQVIHRDLKTSNILLDNDFNPKISDFGLARIFRGDEKEANTNRVVGTYGYISPEYAADGNFSLKSDVFSFGVLLLEIVSGKKNRGFLHPDHHRNLLGHAWMLWNNERALEVMDMCLEYSFIESQVLRCIQVGLLCVQMFPKDRPDMSSVVFMLANEGLQLSQPGQPGFFTDRGFTAGSTSPADAIIGAQFIRDGDTLISASQSFEFGFFTPGKSKNRYLGIWYKFSPNTVVWVANRKKPITDKQGVLVVSDDGNLVLLSNNESIIWSTNLSRVPENPVAQLLDSGNLVLRDNISMNSDSYVWQSFDYPSDTFLAGMKVGWNLRTGFERYLTPWTSADDPSPGVFNLRLDIHGHPQLVITTGSKKVVRTGPWNGLRFDGLPLMPNLVFKPMLVHKQDELYYTFEPFNDTVKTRIVLHQSGKIQRLVWD